VIECSALQGGVLYYTIYTIEPGMNTRKSGKDIRLAYEEKNE
jgi:hypothetical protein